MQIAFAHRDIYSTQHVHPYEYYYGRIGYLGNGVSDGRGAELLNSLYLGVRYKTGSARFPSVNAGIQLQRKFIMAADPSALNYFSTTYNNGSGAHLGSDSFSCRHQSVSLVIGVTF